MISVKICLPYLNTLISRVLNGRLSTTVYRKPTHTDRYLAYDSHHPQSAKFSVVDSLLKRAESIVTDKSKKEEEICHLTEVLVNNGYPRSLIQNASIIYRIHKRNNHNDQKITKKKKTISIPFFRPGSNTSHPKSIKAAFNSSSRTTQYLEVVSAKGSEGQNRSWENTWSNLLDQV